MASKREGIQLCYPYEEKRLLKWSPPYLTQPKLDGERCRAIVTSTGILLVSSEKNIIPCLPHINEAVRKLNLPEGTELDGELYCHGMTFEDIHSVVSRKIHIHEEHDIMQYYIFDIIPVINPKMRQGERLLAIKNLNFCDPLVYVPFKVAFSPEEVMEHYNFYLSQNYEGVIIRNAFAPYERRRSTFVMKFKPKKVDVYEIVDVLEAIDKEGNPKGMVGAFTCRGSDGTLFNIGAGKLTKDECIQLWLVRETLPGKMCEVQYQNLTSTGVPRFGLCIKTLEEAVKDNPAEEFVRGLLMRR